MTAPPTTPPTAVLPRRDDAPPSMQMLEMLYGALATQMLSVAAELGLADLIGDGRSTTAELAAATGTDEPSLYRLLRALAGLGVFAEVADRVFGPSPLGDTLRSDVPGSMKDLAQDVGGRTRLLAYSGLTHSVRTGRPAFDHVHGQSMWSYLQSHPDEVAVFGRAMGNLASAAHATAFTRHDLSDVGHLIDLGGGEGYLLAAVLPRYPGMRGTVYDEPHVVAGAAEVFARAGVADRAAGVGGDVFTSVPAGGDAYVLSSILFSYDDDDAVRILGNVRRAMGPGARVLVLEPVLPEGNDPHPGKLLDITQLALHRGGVRGRAEFEALFAKAGLRLEGVDELWPTGPTDLLVAVAA